MRYNSYGTGTASDHCWALIRPWALLTETPLTAGRFWNSTGWMSLQWCCYPQAGATKILMHQKRFPCSHHSETTAAVRWSTDAMRFEHLHINAAKMITDQGNQCLHCATVCTLLFQVLCVHWFGASIEIQWKCSISPSKYCSMCTMYNVHHVRTNLAHMEIQPVFHLHSTVPSALFVLIWRTMCRT